MVTPGAAGFADDLTPVQRRALDWIALATSGEATESDLAAMEEWRDEKLEHAQALARLSAFVTLAKARPRPDIRHLKAPIYNRPMTRRLALGGLGAAAASYAVVAPPMALWPSLAELSSDYRTAVGERKTVKLAQGLAMELNTGTAVSLRNKPSLPGIEIVHGEVAVTAALPASMQFAAYMPEGRILASNAVFDAHRTAEGFRVTCIQGAIQVEQNGQQVAMSAGQDLFCRKGASGPGTPARIDTLAVTAWQNGQIVFFDAPLRQVVAEINRYRHGRIVIMNSALSDRHINASFWIDRLDNMDALLAAFGNTTATNLPGGIILLT